MKNLFLLNLLGFNPDLTTRQSRVDSVSIASRYRVLATLLLCLTLFVGVGNAWGAALGAGYTKITNITSLSAGDKVVLYCDDSSEGVTGYSGSDATVSTTEDDWIQFTVEKSSSNYFFKTGTKYIKKQTSNKFTIDATSQSDNICTVNGSGVLCIDTRYLCENGSYYRMYTSIGSYKPFYVYKVTVDPHTVTYNAGSGSAKSSDTEASGGAGITLPSASPSAACSSAGWTFAGWKKTSAQSETTSIPTLYAAGSTYYPKADETLYAVYKLGDVYPIDFESTLGTYSDWTFNYIGAQQSTIAAHGGSYYGSTTISSTSNYSTITTNSAIAAPKAIRFYVSKSTTNTTSSTWKVQTSANGSSWDDRASQAAATMGQGEWVEVTLDLSSYSNVYVRVQYGGSTAVRCIDDLMLSCATYNSNPSCAPAGTSVSLTKAGQTNGSFTLSNDGPLTTTTAQSITLTASPNTGYYLSNVTASNPATGTATVTGSGNTRTITYSSGANGSSTITTTFSPIWELSYGVWGDSWGDPEPMAVADGVASCTLSLSAMTKYGFKFHNAQTNTWYGNSGGVVITDISNWEFPTDGMNCRLFTGPAGNYTFSWTIASSRGAVSYPSVSHPSAGYAYFKKQGSDTYIKVYTHHNDAACEVADWAGSVQVNNTTSICNNDYFYFALTDAGGCSKAIIRYNNAGSQKGDFTITSGAYSGKWGSVDDTDWHEFTTYTITFAGNGNTGGSMSNVSSICPSSDVVLASNGYTKTDYDFAGWKTNTAVTINGSTPVAVNGIIPNGATINSVNSNITLTAQWQRDEDQFIDILQNTTGYTEASPHIEYGTYSTPSLSDKAVATSGTCQQQHYHFVGWITAAKYAAGTAISDGDLQTPTTASNATYYAVWAKQGAGGGGAAVNTILWAEDFSGWSDGNVPSGNYTNSHTGTTVYGGATVTYTCVNGSSNTKLYGGSQTLYAGGTAPELLVGKNTGSFSVAGIPSGGASVITISYKQNNKQLTVAASGTGYSGSATNTPGSATTESFDVTVGSDATFTLTFTPSSDNVRIDDLQAKVKTQGISYTDYKAICCTDWSTPTVTYTSPLAIGGTASVSIGSGTTYGAVSYESSDEDVLTVESDGTVTAVGAGTAHVIATWAGDATYCEKSANSNDISVSGILVTGTTPVNFGQVYQNAVVANKTISVTGVNLASAITPSLPAGSPFSFSPATLAANSSGATLTISASTATLGNYNQTLTLTSGAFSTTVTVKMEVIAMPSCTFVDNLHNLTVDASSVPLSSYALTAAQGTAVVFPTLANQVKGASTCEDQHYRFVGWTTSDNNTDPEDHLVTSHTLANGEAITYYAVWADGVAGVSYTKLTSSTFKTSPTTYVIGAEYSSSTYYFYSCAVTDDNNSWGVCSTDPSTDAPIQFTLSGTASALVATSTEGTARYLNPASGKQFFGMSATSKTVVLGASGTIESSAASYNLLRYNYNSGSGGLRWYSSDTGEPAYFYEVVAGSTPSYRTSCCADKVEAPTVTATKTSTSITLTWGDETGATGWEVSWNGGAFGSPSGTRTHTVSGLTPNTTYTWQVRATYDPLVKCGADIASGSTTTNQVYHVTYAKGDGEANCSATGTTTDATGYEAGATVTLQSNSFTLVGHTFAGWTEDDDDITISSNQFTMPDHDVVITASWTAKMDKYFDRMHDQTDALHGGVEETEGTNEGKYYIAKTGCNYSIPTAVDSSTGDACQTSHYKLQGWIAASYVASDGTITPADLAAHLFPPTGTKTATGATYYAVWAEVTE